VSDLVQGRRHYACTAEKPARERVGLSTRELEITSAAVAGFTNKEMARRFALTEDTVRNHLTHIFGGGAFNRLELALFAVHDRLVEPRAPPIWGEPATRAMTPACQGLAQARDCSDVALGDIGNGEFV
jgi:DNA-binding CsgD family transcriptional regulator